MAHTITVLVSWLWDSKEAYGYQSPNEDPGSTGFLFHLNARMPSQELDAETGFFHNGFRDYDPASGRYVESDPLGLAAGWNTYAYVGGDPVMRRDPFGLAYYDKTWGLEDYFFAPTFWARNKMGMDTSLPQGIVDSTAGMGDAITMGATNAIRNKMGTNDQVNKCSGAYLGGEVAWIGLSLALPMGRLGYVVEAARIPKLGLSAEEAVAARNALKEYYRGPLAGALRNWRSTSYEGLLARGRTESQIISSAGRSNIPWTIGLFGSGIVTSGARVRMVSGGQSECSCGP
jgi:RHS repeat-associated protein